MRLKVYTVPAAEPVSSTEAKLQCRIDITDDDTLITNLIEATRTDVELMLRRALITQTWDGYLDAFPAEDYLEIPLPPLSSITSIKYTTSAGVENTFASASYYVDTISEPGRVVLNSGYSWPGDELRAANGVVVRFVCGYGAAGTNVPEPIRQALLMLIGHYYENREATIYKNELVKIPMGVEALLSNYRIFDYAASDTE